MSTDLDKVLQKLQAAQSRNIAQVEQAQKRMGIETHSERQKRLTDEEAARLASENSFYKQAATNNTITPEIAPVYSPKVTARHNGGNILTDTGWGAASGVNSLIQGGLAVADTMLTQHVVNPVNNAYSMFTGDSKPLIPMPESEQKIAGRVVNAGIYQAALKKLGIYDAKAIEEYIAKKYSNEYYRQKAEVDEAVKDIENPLLKFAATFGHSLTKPNLLAAGAGSSLPQALPAGAIGRGAKVANAALSASTRAGIGTAVTSAVVEMGDTAKDKGYSTHRDMAYDLATGAGLGLVSKGLPSSFSTEQIIANGDVSRILANSANRARTTAVNTATETGQEAVQGALESALNQQQKEGKIDWGKVGKDAGMEAAVGFGMAGGPAIVGNIKAAVGDVKGFRSTLKTDPNNKNYDPNYAYQVSAGKAALGEIDIDSAKAEQTQALTTAMSRLTEFDEKLAQLPDGKKKEKLQKKRNDWFNNQVQPLQDTVAALEQVSNLQLSQEMSSDEVLQRILDLNAEAYHNRKQQAEQQLTDAVNYQPEIPEYTNVDGVGTGTTNTQQASTGVIAIGDSIANAFGNQYKKFGVTSYSKDGRNPNEVLNTITKLSKSELQGKTVVLSTGLSNNTKADLNTIRKQIKYLKDNGASVQVMGVANNFKDDSKLGTRMNTDLANIAKEMGVTFLGGFDYAKADKYKAHPDSGWYKPIYDKVGITQAQGQVVSGTSQYSTNFSIDNSNKSRDDLIMGTYTAFRKAGFTDGQARYLIGEVNRENGFSAKTMFGSHSDHANGANNFGFISWQQGRRTNLFKFLKDRGIDVKESGIPQTQASLDAMAAFFMQEMKSGGITLSQYRGGTYDTRNFLKQANPDLKDRRWGHAAIGWAYGQNKLKSGASFDSSTHEAKLDKGHADINRLLGSNYTGSFSSQSSNSNLNIDDNRTAQERLESLITKLKDEKTKTKEAEAQKALQDKISSLEAQVADNQTNSQQEQVSVESEAVSKAQQDTFDEIIRYSEMLSDDMINILVEQGALSEKHAEKLRLLKEVRVVENATKNTDDVKHDIYIGKKAKRAEDGYIGLQSYQQGLVQYLKTDDIGVLDSYYNHLSRFNESHTSKASAAKQAMDSFDENQQPLYIARKADSQEWEVHEGSISKELRAKTGAIEISNISRNFVNNLIEEAFHLNQIKQGYDKAYELHGASDRIKESVKVSDFGLTDFSQINTGVSQQQQPVQVTRASNINQTPVADVTTSDPTIEPTTTPTQESIPVTPPVTKTPSSVPTQRKPFRLPTNPYNDTLARDSSVGEYQRKIQEGVATPNYVWLGRGERQVNDEGKMATVSLSSIYRGTGSAKDPKTGQVTVRSNVFVDENKEVIKAGIFGSPIQSPIYVNSTNAHDQQKLKLIEEFGGDMYSIVHDGTQAGKDAAMIESANRYMDFMRVAVSNNQDFSRALLQMAANPNTGFVVQHKMSNSAFSEAAIVPRVVEELRKHPALQKISYKEQPQAVFNVLSNMGTLMADGQFHSEIQRPIDTNTFGKEDNLYKPHVFSKDDLNKFNEYTATNSTSNTNTDLNSGNAGNNTPPNITDNNGITETGIDENTNTGFDLSVFESHQNNTTEATKTLPTDVSTNTKENSTQEAESSADELITPQEAVAVKRNSSIPTNRASNAITKETVLKPMQVRKLESTSKAKEENKAEDTVYITNTPIEKSFINKPVKVSDLASSIESSQIKTKDKSQAENQALISVLSRYSPDIKVKIQDKTSYDEKASYDDDTIRVSEDSKDITRDIAQAMVHKQIGNIADELDTLDHVTALANIEAKKQRDANRKEGKQNTDTLFDDEVIDRQAKLGELRLTIDSINKDVRKHMRKILSDPNQKFTENSKALLMRATDSAADLLQLGLFNEDVKSVLKQVKVSRGKNKVTKAYHALMDAVTNFFGFSKDESTAYTKLLGIVSDSTSLSVLDSEGNFSKSSEAKIRQLNEPAKNIEEDLTKPITATKDSKVVRNILKTSFRQAQTLHKPLSSIQNFVRELYTNPVKASQILNLEPPTKAQREQINDFAEFTAEFREHLKQVFKPTDEGYENRALANYFYDKQTGEFDSNVLDALSYGAYDYLNSVANHTMNMRDDILALLGLTSNDVEQKNNAYITKEMWETYKYIGSGYVKVADDLGKRIAETLNIQRTENGSITVDSRLYSALGTWALSAMQSADLIHLHSISSEKHKKAIEEVRGVIDEKDFNSHGTVRFVSITNKEGEGINKRINEISEANKGTAGYLTDIMGGVSAVRMPSLKPIEESVANVKRRIKRTDATVTDLQAQRVAKAQAHANVINEPTFSLLTNLASQHEDAFLEMIGAKLKEGELQTAHINDRDGLEGKAEAVMRDWTNAVDFINSIPKVDGVRKYWDTMFMAVNSRMHYNSNVFNYQSSKLHRAMAEPSNFKVTVQLKNKDGSSVLDSLQSKLKEHGKEIHSKHLTKDELNLTYFLRALAENMEGSEDFIEAYFKNTGSKEIFTEGFTVDKLPSYVFIPAFIEYLNQEHIQKATEIVSKAQAGDKISSEEMNHLSSVIDEMAMTGSSLRALREWADFQTTQENNHANFTTSLGLGSDGLNNGAALAHFWNGAFYKELLLRTGFFSFNDPFKSYFDARHDKNLGDYYTAFKNAVINEKAQEAFIMGFHANLEKDLANHNEQVFRALMRVQKSLTKRAVAKSVLIPFNYGAGVGSLKKAVFRTFLKEMQDNITLAAQQDIANKKALEAGQMTQLEYDTQRAKLLNQVMTVDRLFSFMTQKPIQWDITIDNEPKAVVINENLDLKYMLEAWISPKDEAMLDNKYSFTMGQYLAEVLQDYEAVYIEKNKVNMRILSSTVELFTQMYREVEERAIQTVAERISNALVETGLDRGLANELALKEISYRGLSDKEREELVHSVMDKVQAQIHNVYSVQNNESKAKVRLTRLAEILFVDKANLTNNSFFLVNKSGKYQATSFGSPARHIHLEDKALLANSVQTQSMDSYISSFAMAMGKKININVHDANIGAIDNQLDMITQQNKATFQALVSYHGQLESLRALTSVIQSSYALIKDGVIREDFHVNEVFAELTKGLTSLINEVKDTELNKLDQLANLAYLHQYAGEFGEYQVTDADRQTALKEKNKVVDQINQLEKDLALNTTIKVMGYEPNKRTDTTKQQTSESGIVQLSDTRATEQVSQLPTTSTGTDGTQGAAFTNSSSTPTEPTIQNLKQLDQTIKGLVNVSEVQLKLNKMLMGKANQHLSKMSVKFADVTTPNGTRAYGSYNVTTHTLTLDNQTFSQSGNDENKLRVINHELVHALTEYAIISNAQDLRSELNHLNKMLDAVMAQWQEDVAFNKKYGHSRHDTKEDDLTYVNQIMEVIKASQEADTTNGNHYAGLSEFIAYGMTDPEMMRYIDYAMELADLGIKPRKGISSVMDFLVRLASKVLGFKGDGYKAFVQNVETIMDNPPVDLLTLTSNDTRFSASAMKSVQANIKRGTEAMNKAITTKADVKRAMYRNDIGWIDFVWGDTGIIKTNGKTKGAKGISHIIEARIRKDKMSYDEVVEMLTHNIVETIAQGSTADAYNSSNGVKNIKITHKGYFVALRKAEGSNAWVITAFEIFEDGTGKGDGKTSPTHNQSYSARTDVGASNKVSDDGQGVGFDTSKPTHTTPTLARDSMGASDKTNITQLTTDSNEDTRYSQIFDETDRQSVSEVFNSLDSQTLTDGWNKHLQEVWDSLFDGNIAYSTLSEMEQKSLLDTAKQVNKMFVPNTFNMTVKEQLSYQAVTSIVDFLVNNHTDSNITSELNKIHAQLIKAYPTAADLYPDYHTVNDEVKNLYDTEHSKLFKSIGEMNNLASVVALVLSSQTFNELTDQKVELRKTKHDSWFDKFMNLWHKAMNLLRTKYINANSTSEATKQLMAKLVNAETNARLARVSMIDKAWNTVYQKPMDAANWVWDKTWDIGSEAIISGLPMSSQMRDTWRSHKERIKAAKQSENLSKSSVAKDSMNLTIEAGLAITGLDMNMSYGGNQDIKSATRGFIKETVNEMLGQRGVGHTVERVIRIVNKVAQDRANYKQSMLNNFASIMKDPKRFDNHAKQSITRTVMMSDAQTLLHYHGMEQTLNYIANSKQRKVRIKELEDKLQSLSKNREHFNQLLKDTKDLAWYMVGETVSGDVKKNAELIATSAGTRSITPYEQMDQNIFEAVDELVTLHGLEMVNGKYMYTTQDLIQNEGQVLIAMLNTHHDLVKKSKEEFKDNPLNYIKGFKPAIHNPHVDVVAVKAEEVDDYIQKGYEQVLHGSIVQDELDNTEPRYLMINKNAPYARYNSGGLDMKDTHFRGYEVFNYKTNAKELARVGQGRLKRNTELAKTMDARSYDPRNIKGNHLIPRYGNDMLILGYNYEMSGELRDKLLDRDLSFDMMLATMGSELVAKPKLVDTQRTLAQVLAEDAKNPTTGFKISPVHFTVINPNSPDPRVQEMLRMMPYEFYQEMQHQFGKGKPFVIRTAVFNSVFGFRKYNVSEMFDKVSGERNYFEKFMVTLYENIYGKQARNKAANHQYVWEWFVTQAKDLIVIRSVKVLIGNIIANALISAAHGITPTELARGMFYAWKEGKAYRQLQAEEQRINFEMLNATSESQRKKLKAQLVAVRQNMQNSGMHEYMEEGLMSTIVEDIDMGSETKLFKSDFEKKLDNLAEKIPQPVRTTMKWATFHPDTEIHKFLSESTQFSDFAAKFVLAKHIERKSLKMGKSKKAAFEDGIQMAQEVFINYDIPTNRTLQAANDLGLFMFTKFTVRFQRALARQLHQNGGHAMLQHFMVEEYLPVAGLLNPFFPMFNTGLGAFTGIGALAQLPLIAMFL
ncbi:Uncharacterised protein [Moraxella catarrhalis]|uniref:putative barnase/colicin E5 family endoribonuclease n=1 Tax=Moraxella catarrhalis TaxID=480 RepID=UPI0007B4134A|nr:hypothetical protein [Moraxella catarrhalis]AVH82469.1 hypothetical protein A6J52_06635 [Moraxella catarrhalis]KZR94200.1 hypothetical protein A4U55_08140 [Moraxella catarrhalis]SQH69821.1 Uncharacterised protein [Moraxella catarrhalis]